MVKHLCLVSAILVLAGCSGGSEEPASLAPKPENQLPGVQPPAPASLIWATQSGLFRSQTDGSGQVTLAEDSIDPYLTRRSGSSVFYVVARQGHRDIWGVNLDGTGQHAVANTDEDEILRDVIGGWVIHDVELSGLASVRFDGSASRVIAPEAFYQGKTAGRAVFSRGDNTLSSVLPDGSDTTILSAVPRNPNGDGAGLLHGMRGSAGSRVIYTQLSTRPTNDLDLWSVPVTGGPTIPLADSPAYELFAAVVSDRVVYNRCTFVALPDLEFSIDHCDVLSVRGNGQERIALTDTPDINYVQGAIGEQVIIRRSQRGGTTDHLVSIPVNGGEETPLLTLSWDEFVMGMVDDRIIVQRPSGIWSIKADGSGLVQLTAEAERFTFGSAGPFACFARGSALWCVPADGSAQPTQVAENGTFVEGL